MNTTQPVRILHLSDIHFRGGTAWDRDPLLHDLAGFVAGEVQGDLKLVPDLVAITGDLADWGLAADYQLARTWLEQELWPALSLNPACIEDRRRLLLVPGNHDVDRERISKGARHIQDGLLRAKTQEAIADILKNEDDRGSVLKRHTNYLAFYGDWRGEPQPLPWWQHVITIRGQRLHIAGLDSAWMACCDGDRGFLLLGRYQLSETVLHPDSKDADWRLALLHHPWDYLAEFDAKEARPVVHLKLDLVLRGHRHESEVSFIQHADPTRTCLELAAGCVYDSSRYPNAFQWIELWPATPAEPRQARVLFRLWNHGAWTIDRNQTAGPDPDAWFDIDRREVPVSVDAIAPPAPPDLRRYLGYLRDATGYIEVRGLSTGDHKAHRYPIGDLYIELQAAGGADPADARRQERGADNPLCAALGNSRLVISGDPGCGKTTFLRWVAQCLAVDRLDTPGSAAQHLGLDPAPVPVLVQIGQWQEYINNTSGTHGAPAVPDSPDWLPVFLGAHAAEHHLGLDTEMFRHIFDGGDALILFDGLDEAPDRRQRATTARIIEQVALSWSQCPLVVTSRPAALTEQTILPGFAHTTIDALDSASIDGFLGRWSRALFDNEPTRAEAHRRELAAALTVRPEIRRLARNALMLTALAVVHWHNKRLPEQRTELYESIVRWLLLAREDRPGRIRPEASRQLLADLALTMQGAPGGRATQLSRRAAAERIAHRFPPAGPNDPAPVERAEAYLADEELDSGIIVRRGHDLCYWHLTFQEYLAACAIAGKPDEERLDLLLKPASDPPLDRPEWRETVLLLGGVLYLQGQDRVEALIGAIFDRIGAAPRFATQGRIARVRTAQARTAGLIGAMIRDLTPFGYRLTDPRYAQVLKAALAVFDPQLGPAIPLADRLAAADALARAGDPRLGWDRPERWVEVREPIGGTFNMGAQNRFPDDVNYDPAACDDEWPVIRVKVNAFRIGRFPVTVAEFATFLADEDCSNPCWWRAGGADQPIAPDDWEDQQAHPSRPVVRVSWYQAMAYCGWVTEQLRRCQGIRDCPTLPEIWQARLPTDAEWEYAARGKEGRRYPWGLEIPDAGHVNSVEAGIGSASPVGVFPGDSTPEGILDLAGNVEEWCLNGSDIGVSTESKREPAIAPAFTSHELRGGSFCKVPVNFRARNLRAASRNRKPPQTRSSSIGFRCILALPHLHT